MKVFKMNDCDWVAHHSEKQAKEFYKEFTGTPMEDIEEFFEGEVSLTDTMYWDAESVDKKDSNHNFSIQENSPYGVCYKIPFSWAIKNYPELYPGIIASTEY